MGMITEQLAITFRDFVTAGVAASGEHKPAKSDIRALGPVIETAIANVGLGALVDVVKDTRANLNADLAHAANSVALVYADATDANNDLYIKVGASGAGSWTLTTALHDIVEALVAPKVAGLDSAMQLAIEATASIAAVKNVIRRITMPNIWMDPVGGDDGNSGLFRNAPIKTFDALKARADWVPGAVVAYLRPEEETLIRDGLYDPDADDRTIVSWGQGRPLPILDGTDLAPNASFTVNATYSNCYDIVWSHDLTSSLVNPNASLQVYKGGKPLKRRATLAEVAAEDGTYHYAGTAEVGVAKLITVHPYDSTNAITDGALYEITKRPGGIFLGDRSRADGFYLRRFGSNDGNYRLGYDGRTDVVLSELGTKHNYVVGDGVHSDLIAVNCIDQEYRPEGDACILGTGFVPDASGRKIVFNRCGFVIDPSVYGNTISTGQFTSTSLYFHDGGVSQFDLVTLNDCWMSKTGGMTPQCAAMEVNDFYYAAPNEASAPFAFAAYFPIKIRGGVFCNAARIVDGPFPDVEGLLAINDTVSASGGLFAVFSATQIEARIVNNMFLLDGALNENQAVVYFPAANAGSTLTWMGNICDGARQTVGDVDDADMTITAQDNVYLSKAGNSVIFNVNGVQKSFAQWQALGYDSNAVEASPQWLVAKPTIASPNIALVSGGTGDVRLGASRITQNDVDRITSRPVTLAAIKAHLNGIDAAPIFDASSAIMIASDSAVAAIEALVEEAEASTPRGRLGQFVSTGDIVLNAETSGNLGTTAAVADVLMLFPLIPPAQDLTLSALAGYVTTGVASAKLRFGIYADNNGKPDGGALICQSAELDAATSSTALSSAVTAALEEGGKYWVAILSGHAPTLRAINLAACMPLAQSTDLSATPMNTHRRVARTFGALPSTCPTGTGLSAGAQPAVGLVIG